jgi:hypothetical protein
VVTHGGWGSNDWGSREKSRFEVNTYLHIYIFSLQHLVLLMEDGEGPRLDWSSIGTSTQV